MSFYGAPKPAPPVLPPYGSKLPHTRRHSTKLYFKTHDAAVAFCKQQKRHLAITVVSKLVDDKLVKHFVIDFAPKGHGNKPNPNGLSSTMSQ